MEAPEAARPAPEAEDPVQRILALQRSAGNQAIARSLSQARRRTVARGLVGYVPGSTAQHKAEGLADEPMVTVVAELTDPDGGKTWLRIKDAGSGQEWLYVSPRGSSAERYVKWSGDGTYTGNLKTASKATAKVVETEEQKQQRREKSEAIDKAEDERVLDQLTKGTWAENRRPPTERFTASKGDRNQLKIDLTLGLQWETEAAAWIAPYDTLGARVKAAFQQLLTFVDVEGAIEMTGDLIAKTGQVVDPLRAKNRSKKEPSKLALEDQREISQSLAEIEYLIVVVAEKQLAAPYVLGAKSRMKAPQRIEPMEKEDPHGSLPPLHTLNFEVDGYYRTADGVVHADEVKDSPRAFADKVEREEQLKRQLEWLELPVNDEKGPVKKQVSYFIRGTTPYWDRVLERKVIGNLRLLDKLQPKQKFIRVADQAFGVDDLQDMMDKALDWYTKSKPALTQDPACCTGTDVDPKKAFLRYFGDLRTAQITLEKGPLTVNQPVKV